MEKIKRIQMNNFADVLILPQSFLFAEIFPVYYKKSSHIFLAHLDKNVHDLFVQSICS